MINPEPPADYDNIVSAEILDPDLKPRLYSIVKRCMLHSPCGVVRKRAPYMRDGKCSKKLPKRFTEFTTTGNDSFPVYQR